MPREKIKWDMVFGKVFNQTPTIRRRSRHFDIGSAISPELQVWEFGFDRGDSLSHQRMKLIGASVPDGIWKREQNGHFEQRRTMLLALYSENHK
jgi:hypothetical protein